MENPFAGLRPEMRSEHDEIRKGIFSRVLRNLQSAPLAERREWCKAIRATYSAAQAAKLKRAAATVSSNAALPSPAPSPSWTTQPSAPAVGAKRTHSAVEASAPTPAPLVADATREPATGSPSPTTSAAILGVAGGDARDGEKAEEALKEGEEGEESEAVVKECIAAYLRSLLDRVVGVSLENLNVPALRILCTMVGIKTEVRNKIGLYSTLASFYYTECEKLGKRVSRDTVFERQVEQEVAMLKHVSPSSSSRKNGDKRASAQASDAGPVPTTTTTTSSMVRSGNGNSKTLPAAVVVSVTSKRAVSNTAVKAQKKTVSSTQTAPSTSARSHQATKAAKTEEEADVDHYLKYENLSEELEDQPAVTTPENPYYQNQHYHSNNNSAYGDDEGGEVVYQERVFSRPDGRNAAAAAAPSHMAKYAASANEGEWSMLMLERKVASIVQLHDPVTAAIVVKKLSQLGYHEPNAVALVEQILRRFHDRQLIYYDTGIAYLM
ncbi:hypothetical protein ABB37_07535 [Leptomonas pyrrhocoris]|uniref:Uncharacterized protein n=1 Tax=Leptomonas pyrrhocoris TaxID=157538 RepID=A0A0M9FVA9_LEPPY|nr:hypothetical protein ABB37_07535 [Leptomonas pyrrhocoris]XP_015655127.1 hypothetical protein ABB37_07535 [Leptomonas pyrrhocoris]KPA76687.1 hypothetical protein ABB37_07535 [Leptomonas pyrrhocoris]KPA76688.1 hypothetical protein ABB37_07535 [Leptomonas pyrrhocoris]|eukprot:XP_015655126.1 hypothetical protein ABB37_07535 [Leptomonas pyrrhocoris]